MSVSDRELYKELREKIKYLTEERNVVAERLKQGVSAGVETDGVKVIDVATLACQDPEGLLQFVLESGHTELQEAFEKAIKIDSKVFLKAVDSSVVTPELTESLKQFFKLHTRKTLSVK